MKGPCSHEWNCGYYEHAGGCVGGGGSSNAGESPGLSCCCTFHPPREILTFSAQLPLCLPSLSEGMNPTGRRGKKERLPLDRPPFFSVSSGGGTCATVLAKRYGMKSSADSPTQLHTHATVTGKLHILLLQKQLSERLNLQNPKHAVTLRRVLRRKQTVI